MNISKDFGSRFDHSRRILTAFIAANILVFSNLAQSATVYSKLPLDRGDGPASFYVEHSGDDFSLAENKRITGVQFYGSFTDTAISNNSFDIRFFENNGGVPGTLISESLSVTTTRRATGLTDIIGGEVFRFSTRVTSVSLLANTLYFLSVVHPDDAVNDEFFWLLSNTTGNNYTRNTSGADTSWKVGVSAPGDLAFNLIPEPGAPFLFALAFLLFGYHRRSISN